MEGNMKKLLCVIVFVLPAVLMVSCGSTCPSCPAQEQVFTAQFQDGVWPNSAFAGITDSSIFESTPDSYVGAAILCSLNSTSGSRARVLFKFDLRGYLPSNINVTRAFLTLNTTTSSIITAATHVVTQADDMAVVTWNTAGPGLWSPSAGGTFQGTVSGSAQFNGTDSVYTVEIDAATVKKCLTDPLDNYGIMLVSADEGVTTAGLSFRSSDYGTFNQRPMLTVYYTMN